MPLRPFSTSLKRCVMQGDWNPGFAPAPPNPRIPQVWAIDLLGYGYSDKPIPDKINPNTVYNFENWGQQLRDFITEIVQQKTFVITNSVGGVLCVARQCRSHAE